MGGNGVGGHLITAVLWSALAERSGDGAFVDSIPPLLPKRRRASLAAALHIFGNGRSWWYCQDTPCHKANDHEIHEAHEKRLDFRVFGVFRGFLFRRQF